MRTMLESSKSPKLVGTISISDEESLKSYKKALYESLSKNKI